MTDKEPYVTPLVERLAHVIGSSMILRASTYEIAQAVLDALAEDGYTLMRQIKSDPNECGYCGCESVEGLCAWCDSETAAKGRSAAVEDASSSTERE